MVNLIGTDVNLSWLQQPLVHLHWYDKEVRPGRKVGHLNLTDSDTERLSAALNALVPQLPEEYASGIAGRLKNCNPPHRLIMPLSGGSED